MRGTGFRYSLEFPLHWCSRPRLNHQMADRIITFFIYLFFSEVPSQRCAIHLAAQFNLVHIAQILIDFEANVNKFDIDGNTPLHSAVSSGNRKLTQLLLGAGASTNVPGKNGILPLSSAVQQADIGIVEDLLDYGSLVHVHNARGQTALHRAVLKDSIDLVEALLSRGASGNSQDIEGDTPLSLACEMRRADLVKVILKSDNSKKTHLSGSCVGTKVPLHIAAARGKSLYARFHSMLNI